ncbi:imidazoleglycerol-phosphate dehydratase HisB [Alienimonas chondri]|uniref:Imidazoleglycerol-phosphate dehydratase n=1 Tax=Alienimonas chondri TaxID=2681879 RepID=A0ABX1VE60_9PLAN|nr:imidazoleglycerol-phosphate dehydratase HisB [Alienimonas chondri]NNJ26175.1 Histidine biosynthesis bifunctional protein HisB [Alienimonas chondri]
MPEPRTATIDRKTGETDVSLSLNLDGSGDHQIATGAGFLDHMLELFARHGLFDLTVKATGDTHVDFHHTTEDVGICLGQALKEAVGDKSGIVRYGSMALPMEDALVTVALDLSGRPMLVWDVAFPAQKVGNFDTELVREFWQAVANAAGLNLHCVLCHGVNAHHIAEAVFKGCSRSLRTAVTVDPRQTGVPSSKGVL